MAAPQWLQDIGAHIKGVGEGLVDIIQGAGATLQANAAFTQSSAQLQTAQAQNYQAELALRAEQQQAENRKSMLLILLMFGVPLIIIIALFAFKNRG